MKRVVTFAAALAFAAAPAQAQDETLLEACNSLTITTSPDISDFGATVPADIQDQFSFLCGQVANTLSNVQPTIGIAFSGGAHTLGTYTTIGRRLGFLPRISATARLNVAVAQAPNLLGGDFSPTLTDGETLGGVPTAGLPVASLQGDVVIGVFNGVSVGPAIGGMGSVDLLGSVSFIPSVSPLDSIIGLTESIVNIGVGARVGILKQGLVMPGVSVSAMYRTMGEVGFGDMDNPDPAAFAADLSVISLRAGVSKGLLMFDVAAGAGYDIYSSNTRFNWNMTYTCPDTSCGTTTDIQLQPSSPVEGQLKTAAWNLHANVGLSILLLDIVGEVGYQKATDVLDAAAFQEAGLPDQAPTEEDLAGGRFFVSFGARLTL